MTHDDAVRTLAAERYLLDEMSDVERHEFEAHFFDCETCAAEVRAGARLSAAAAEAEAPPVPAPVVPFRRRSWPTVVAPWAAAAALAVVAGYQALITIPALRGRLAPHAVTPLILRPATRGEAPVVSLAGPSPLVLSLDVNVAPASGELDYDVRQDTGTQVASGRTKAPLPGTPLLILLAEAPAAGSYVVTLRDPEGRTPDEGSYRFTVR